MELITAFGKLRPYQLTDAPRFAELANNPRIAQNMRNLFRHPYTLKDAEAFMQLNLSPDNTARRFAIEVSGELAGGCGLHPFSDVETGVAELGYWLAEPYWGRGLATEAVRVICQFGFAEMGLRRIQACVYSGNTASERVLQKVGFQREGVQRNAILKNGVVRDSIIYGLLPIDLNHN